MFRFQTVDGTAVHGADYSKASGTIRFKNGKTVAAVRVKIKADQVSDPNEWFMFQLFSPVGATLDRTIATGTILGG